MPKGFEGVVMKFYELKLISEERLYCSNCEKLILGKPLGQRIYMGIGKSVRIIDLLCPECMKLEKETNHERND